MHVFLHQIKVDKLANSYLEIRVLKLWVQNPTLTNDDPSCVQKSSLIIHAFYSALI